MQQTLDWTNALASALDAVAKHHAEHDDRRRRAVVDEARHGASILAERIGAGSPEFFKLFPSAREPFDPVSSAAATDVISLRDGIAAGFGSDGHGMVDQFMAAVIPNSPVSDRYRMIADHADRIDEFQRLNRARRPDPLSVDGYQQTTSGRGAQDESIAQLAMNFDTPLRGPLEIAGQMQDSLGGQGVIASAIAPDFASSVRPQGESGIDKSAAFATANGYTVMGRGFSAAGSTRDDVQTAEILSSVMAHGSLSGATDLNSIIGAVAERIGPGNAQVDPDKSHATPDRGTARNTDGGNRASSAATGSAQEGMAAAADQLERLTAAVRRTIDELERVRGAVQPPLPALPLNRGTFRFS